MTTTVEAWATWWRRRAPRWFRRVVDDVGDRLISVLGGNFGLLVEGAREAALSGSPLRCPEDAVPHHAAERMIEPIAGESVGAWRVRIAEAWDHWDCGTADALGALIGLYAGCTATVYGVRWCDVGAFSAGYGDANQDRWARLAVVLTDHSWTRDLLCGGSGVVAGPDALCGTTLTGTELRTVRRIFRTHRPAHCGGIDVVLVYDSATPSDVLTDHTYPAGTYDIHMFPLGPRKLCGYLHHGAYAGAAICGEEVA